MICVTRKDRMRVLPSRSQAATTAAIIWILWLCAFCVVPLRSRTGWIQMKLDKFVAEIIEKKEKKNTEEKTDELKLLITATLCNIDEFNCLHCQIERMMRYETCIEHMTTEGAGVVTEVAMWLTHRHSCRCWAGVDSSRLLTLMSSHRPLAGDFADDSHSNFYHF